MSNERSPYGPLDPRTDPERWERAVASIVGAARPELQRRAGLADPVAVLFAWTRPVLALAASIAALCGGTIAVARASADLPATEVHSFSEALVPSSLAAWLEGASPPGLEEIVLALSEEG